MQIKPYGDTLDDGRIQLSFTLPLDYDALGMEAAKQMTERLGLVDVSVVFGESLGQGFSYYIVYGRTIQSIDTSLIQVSKVETKAMSKEEIENMIEDQFGREIVFVGASTGSDAHTVGIDAIMNMKGYAGHYGLERYKHIKAINLGSQVPNEELIQVAKKEKAEVILVSQTVTQKEVHIRNLIELVELLEAEQMREKVVLICGGARISHELAKELGYDAGFGPGYFAEDVAAFAIQEILKRRTT